MVGCIHIETLTQTGIAPSVVLISIEHMVRAYLFKVHLNITSM